jgi:protein tyrosine/serine phosphatase
MFFVLFFDMVMERNARFMPHIRTSGGALKRLSRYGLFFLLSLFSGCVSAAPPAPVEIAVPEPEPVPAVIDAVIGTEIPAPEPKPEILIPWDPEKAAENRRAREREIGKLQKSKRRSNYSSDAVFANFREIRGGTIPAGVLYRSCHPAREDARAPYAARLAEQARIASVINLADNREELEVKAAFIPWYQKFITKNSIIPLDLGPDYADPAFKAGLGEAFRFMLNHRGPYLFHCNDGNNLTGFAAALLQALSGAAVDEITGDYMLTYINYYHFTKDEERYRIVSTFIAEVLTELNGGKPVYNNGGIKKAAERYLTEELGLTGAELDALKRIVSGL